jgi:hypothetical protein
MLDATVVHQFGAEEYPPFGGVVIFNPNGLGKLRVTHGPFSTASGKYDGFLLLDSVPLVRWQGTECPTCERLLQAATGSPTEAAFWANETNELTLEDVVSGNSEWVTRLRPLLQLLVPGFYALTIDHYYPTDGDGQLFWGEQLRLRPCQALSAHVEGDVPAFLVATQPTSNFRGASMTAARQSLNKSPGIAYKIGGRVSALLDGHHRALTAALDRTTVACVTIRRIWGYLAKPGQMRLQVFDHLSLDTKQMPAEASEWLNGPSHSGSKEPALLDEQVAEFLRDGTPESSSTLPASLSIPDITAAYPTDQMLGSLLRIAGPKRLVSDAMIEEVLTVEAEYQGDAHCARDMLNALVVLRDPRATNFAMRVAGDFHWRRFWLDAYRFLATRRSDEVDDFFVEFLVDDDGSRPEIKAMIDDYFRGHP